MCLKLVYFNIALALAYLVARELLFSTAEGTGLAIWIVIIIAEAAFIIYDFLFSRINRLLFQQYKKIPD